ncbi:hypothetical protein FH609_014060 [Streptomyces sp. 3MP-14]|uniref:Uncharacterized protein n=1 Tax=Streptomyces mimosae TaxID=2586635 RepID=A0A5N6A8S4_9ACTN|nr:MULTISPECIES: hypothetical protein [Streptomyces]KAB8164319.1 hypothetical protein FH607_016950 [Streptomyces mimosae]KAB8176596.1 hypothetical protein FH609_014060 [Streptomyces sp. 3MP-14]
MASIVLAVLTLSLATAPGAAARQASDACVPEVAPDTRQGTQRLLSMIEEWRAEGSPEPEIDRRLAEVACLTPAGDRGASTEIPPADGLTVTSPNIYTIGEVNGRDRWIAFTEWRWNTIPGYPMTGNQAVSTWFSAQVSPVLQVVHHAGATDAFPNVSREDAADVNANGVGFLIRPERNANDMNVATGSLALVFETGACTDLTARSAFAHTWNNTGINGLSVAATGVTHDWTNQIDRALTVSQPTQITVCP